MRPGVALVRAGLVCLAAARCAGPAPGPAPGLAPGLATGLSTVVPPHEAESVLPGGPPAGLCRVGADGGIPLADRGIGGTGAPSGVRVADRGIGGTGAPGHTGIVGVITGFASVCLAGQEVQYEPDVPVMVDGRAARLDTLRAGQVAVVVAGGAAPGGPGPVAVSLAIRHEVSGPVESVQGPSLLIARQRVDLPPDAAVPAVGSWVAVSGFHRDDGGITATRLDARPPGEVLVRGIMRMAEGRLWIGLIEVRPGRWQDRRTGVPVVAIGRLNDGVLEADTVEVDALAADPEAFFGPAVQVLVLEGYAEGGVLRFGRGFRTGSPIDNGRALARLERGAGGRFAPAAVRASPGGASGAGPGPAFAPAPGRTSGGAGRFEAAPVPNRGMDRAGRDGAENGRGGAGDRGGRRGGQASGEGAGRRNEADGANNSSGPAQGGGFGAPGGARGGGR